MKRTRDKSRIKKIKKKHNFDGKRVSNKAVQVYAKGGAGMEWRAGT